VRLKEAGNMPPRSTDSKVTRQQQRTEEATKKRKKDAEEDEQRRKTECADSEAESKRKPTVKELRAIGHFVVTRQQISTYIVVAYVKRFGEPDETDWKTIATVLSKETGLKPKTIKGIFKSCRSTVTKRGEDPTVSRPGQGRKHKLGPDNAGLKAAAIALNTGMSVSMAMHICNQQNKDSGVSVCRNTLVNLLKEYTDVDLKATLRCKTGKKDEESDWAKGRLAFAEQLKEQIRLGERIDAGEMTYAQCNAELPPLWKDGTLWCDESHTQQVLPGGVGHQSSFSRRQWRISMDPHTRKLLPLDKGGKMPFRKYRIIPKYPQEARAAYAVATPTIDGVRRGKMTDSWNYTGKKLLSVNGWNKKIPPELARIKELKTGDWVRYKHCAHPYQERFGDDWEKHLTTCHGSQLKGFRSIQHLIDHLIDRGNKMFEDTNRKDTWMIYHDHLKILWEKDSIAYMKSLPCPIDGNPNRTWFDRFIKITGTYCDRVHKRYKYTLPGDSPELMPLDCHLFADIQEALARNIAMSSWMAADDKLKYCASTPLLTYKSIIRTIQAGCPSEDRIIQD
jgi:hypothetical protein